MTFIPSSTAANAATFRGQKTDLSSTDIGHFMDLLLVQLQNQDPFEPMESSEMLQQIGLIRQIGATDQLSTTLNAMLLGQNLSTASALIGKEVSALADDGTTAEGTVDRVSIAVDENDNNKRTIKVHIGDQSFDVNRVREIRAVEAESDVSWWF